ISAGATFKTTVSNSTGYFRGKDRKSNTYTKGEKAMAEQGEKTESRTENQKVASKSGQQPDPPLQDPPIIIKGGSFHIEWHDEPSYSDQGGYRRHKYERMNMRVTRVEIYDQNDHLTPTPDGRYTFNNG